MKATHFCNEAYPLLRMWIFAQQAKILPKDRDLAFCYDMLNKVSRSFAIVIQQLPEDLRNSVCVFYLVLRALDTVEDDMAIPVEKKLPVLKSFHRHIYDKSWRMDCGTKHYARLMREYPAVTSVFLRLPAAHQKVIEEMTKRMADGMAEFIEREVVSVADYDRYCYFVAGIVGIGLSRLYAVSGLESKEFENMEDLSISMGLFLQKTNIIRDYLEDIMEEPAPRMFWPRQIWSKYAGKLEDFKDPKNKPQAVKALNELVTDALRHAEDGLEYMSRLRNPDVFRFCAIPQVMAIATLAEIYNNHKVFTGVVKVRRGVVAQYMAGTTSMADLERAYLRFSQKISERCKAEASGDPSARLTLQRTAHINQLCTSRLSEAGQPTTAPPQNLQLLFRFAMLLLGCYMVVKSLLATSSVAAAILKIILLLPVALISAVFIYSSSQRV